MGDQKRYRDHSPEFRVRIAERMAAGETVTALAHEFGLTRSMMYRWRDAYRKEGAAGLQGSRGRPAATAENGLARQGEKPGGACLRPRGQQECYIA